MLSDKQAKSLKKLAHHLKVVIIIGQNGLSETVLAEIDSTLERHELLKIRVNAGDKEGRDAIIAKVAKQTKSEVVQSIGHVAVFYRRAEDHKLEF